MQRQTSVPSVNGSMSPASSPLPPHLLDRHRLAEHPPLAGEQGPAFQLDNDDGALPTADRHPSPVNIDGGHTSPEKSPALPKHLLDRSRLSQPPPSIRKGIDATSASLGSASARATTNENDSLADNISMPSEAKEPINDKKKPIPSRRPRPRKASAASLPHTSKPDNNEAIHDVEEQEHDNHDDGHSQSNYENDTAVADNPEALNSGVPQRPDDKQGVMEDSQHVKQSDTATAAAKLHPTPKPRPRPLQSPTKPIASAAEEDDEQFTPLHPLLGGLMNPVHSNDGANLVSAVPITVPSPKPRPRPQHSQVTR